MKKSNYRYLISFLCLSVIITILFAYATSCSNNNEPELAESSSQIKITEIKEIKDVNPNLIKLILDSQSRSVDWPTWGDGDDGLNKLQTIEFQDEEEGITAQIAQSPILADRVFCAISFDDTIDEVSFSMQNIGDGYYIVYDENGNQAFELHNSSGNSLTCTRIISQTAVNNRFCRLVMGYIGRFIENNIIGQNQTVKTMFNIAWHITTNLVCR